MSSSLSYDPGGEVSRVLKAGVARRMVLFLVWLSSIRAVGQQLQNDQFRVAFSSAGITSIKRVQDTFDTDYILGGRTLGDVMLRYRPQGGLWKETSSATSAARLSRLIPRIKPRSIT